MKISDFSEEELLSRIVPGLPTGQFTLLGSGDDCAQVSAPGGNFVVTTDVLVEDQHFRRDWSTGEEVGRRAAAQNLADIAAMGALPTALVVSLVLPEDLEISWLEGLCRGLAHSVRPTGGGIVGGDLTRGPAIVVSITAQGWVPGRLLTRSGARPGDTVAVAGTLGLSAAGLASLSSGALNPEHHGSDVAKTLREAVAIYRSPEPPLEAGIIGAQNEATAMMDISDGLIKDCGRMARASKATFQLESKLLRPYFDSLTPAGVELGVDPWQWVLFGGEDHSLLATFPGPVPTPFRAVGKVVPSSPGAETGVLLDGQSVSGGWDHFRR